MGGFHIAQNFLGAIGHLMQSTGMEDIMVKGDVCLRGTANKFSSGKDSYELITSTKLAILLGKNYHVEICHVGICT